MFKSYGIIEVNNGIRVNIDLEIIKYYRRLFNYYVFNTVRNQLPAHKGHISIILPDIHKGIDFLKAKHYDGQRVDFTYNPEDVFISKKNVWINVNLPIGEKIKKELNVVEENFWGYHMVVCNFKFK